MRKLHSIVAVFIYLRSNIYFYTIGACLGFFWKGCPSLKTLKDLLMVKYVKKKIICYVGGPDPLDAHVYVRTQ